jgi:hypothetical protein
VAAAVKKKAHAEKHAAAPVSSTTWPAVIQQLVTVALLVAGACVLVGIGEKTIAATFAGAAGGVAFPAIARTGRAGAVLPIVFGLAAGGAAAAWL